MDAFDQEEGNGSAGGEFDWDSHTQGLLLSGFFYGYAASQLPAGWLVARAGGANLMGAGIAGSALLSLLAPVAARCGGAGLLLAVRVVQGMLQGFVFPGAAQLLARWAPPTERSRLYAVIVSGINVGNVITLPVSGLLATHWGWPSAFYCAGVLGVLWWLLWWTQIADSPEVDKRVSLTERDYIKEKIGTVTVCSKVISHPWRKILTSPPYLAKVFATFCADWAFYTVQTQIPMYLKDTLGYNLRGAGFVSALPFVAMGCFQLVAGSLADLLEGRNLLHTTTVRKLYICGGFMMLVLCMLFSTYLTDPSSIVACITFGTAFIAFVYTASSVNILDMAPLHASVLAGLSNTIANLSGMLTPQITGFIVRTQSAAEWRVVFYVTSGVCLLGGAVYGLLGSGELQPWAEDGLEPPVSVALVAVKAPRREDGGVDNPAASVS
ncbi:hypothetical protein R5R35_003469 [Gryllus longicercus]|uniref:Major facilitator superfamily (MFS) profile domain-containing protein n=1 Tax=Gryllus longicercus TaxID=2509291 RepID=A0AAN9YTF8_9ORTH